MKQLQLTFLCCMSIFLLITFQELAAQDHTHQYGKIDFPLSCNQQAGNEFATGLALLHHMMYEQAEARFMEAAKADPDCAMAHWGVAMSIIHPLWGERPSDQALAKGQKAIAKAKALNPPTERESAYITALESFFKDWQNTDYAAQLVTFEAGFKQLHQSVPEDIDGAAFFALGHLATAPKADKTFAHQKKAGKLLEELHAKNPQHPGLFHYIIHAYDNPMLAERAVEVARAYDKIAPEVPHALHMPSHIFVRLGMWKDVINWNKRSAAAALRQPVGDMTSMHYGHALDYLMYAYLQRGEDRKAKKVLNKINSVDNLQLNLGSAYAIAAIQTRYPLERGKWQEAAAIPERAHKTFPLSDYPMAESMIYFARGMGAAQSDNTKEARKAIKTLNDLHDKLVRMDEGYWATLADAQRTAVMAWLALSEDEQERALSLMKEAADKEDSVDKHPVTPGHILPARELLGDMLLMMDKPAEALKAYEASLETSVNRLNSLYGAGYAAELTGDIQKAKNYYTALVDITTRDEIDRPTILRAQEFVAKN